MRQGLLSLTVVSTLITASVEAFVASTTTTRTTTTSLAASTSRRESFGDILGSALLPVAASAATASAPQAARGADDYPFKVRYGLCLCDHEYQHVYECESSSFISLTLMFVTTYDTPY